MDSSRPPDSGPPCPPCTGTGTLPTEQPRVPNSRLLSAYLCGGVQVHLSECLVTSELSSLPARVVTPCPSHRTRATPARPLTRTAASHLCPRSTSLTFSITEGLAGPTVTWSLRWRERERACGQGCLWFPPLKPGQGTPAKSFLLLSLKNSSKHIKIWNFVYL